MKQEIITNLKEIINNYLIAKGGILFIKENKDIGLLRYPQWYEKNAISVDEINEFLADGFVPKDDMGGIIFTALFSEVDKK